MRSLILLLAASIAWAQAPKAPVSYNCAAEDLEAAGLTCSAAHPCPVYVELASLETLAGKIFLAGNLHTDDATLSSILLLSDDGGRTWTEPHKRVSGAGIEQIQFIDFETGWIGGQLLQGRPHDAFLLITRDGGKTWQARPLFEDGRTGMIQQFWFENKNSGSLLIDRMQPTETGSRYELYQSQTGGESWTLLEVSARQLRIPKSRAGEGNPDWRLRADGPSKSYHIEQKISEKWRTVAMFPILVAKCSTAETNLLEPPQEPETKPAEPEIKAPTLKKKKG